MTNEQISESGPASAIPHSLIQAIFSHFDPQAEVVNLITLVKAINGGIDLEQDRFDLVLFMIYGLWQKQYQTNLFALNFIKHKTKVVVIDRKSNFNDHERWKRFSVLITKAQREFLNLLIKQLLNVPVDKLKAIIMKNPLWVDQDKLNKLSDEQIKASFVMTWWNDCDLKFSFD